MGLCARQVPAGHCPYNHPSIHLEAAEARVNITWALNHAQMTNKNIMGTLALLNINEHIYRLQWSSDFG
jgi:hypothetical protein